MNTGDSNRNKSGHDEAAEQLLQSRAEQAELRGEPAGVDALVDRYRLVWRALRQPPPHALPADFTQAVMARIAHVERRRSREDLWVSLLLLLLGLAGAVASLPHLLPVVQQLGALAGLAAGQAQPWWQEVPWALLGAALACIAAVMAVDHLLGRRQPAQPGHC